MSVVPILRPIVTIFLLRNLAYFLILFLFAYFVVFRMILMALAVFGYSSCVHWGFAIVLFRVEQHHSPNRPRSSSSLWGFRGNLPKKHCVHRLRCLLSLNLKQLCNLPFTFVRILRFVFFSVWFHSLKRSAVLVHSSAPSLLYPLPESAGFNAIFSAFLVQVF